MTAFREEVREGVRTILPLVPATATVGLAAGVAGPAAGLTPVQTVGLSLALYFPSVMLAALGLVGAGVPPSVVVLASLVVGVRAVVLSLGIAPYVRRFSIGWKLVLAYLLWTPVYALTVGRFAADPEADVRGYYVGLALPLWVTVQTAVVGGAAFSAAVPPGLQFEFVVPLAFIALLTRFVIDGPTVAAALVGAATAVLVGGVPYGLGLVVATAGGTLAGAAVARRAGGS